MPIDSAYHLMARYPYIGNYIQTAWNKGHYDELLDFLFGLELEEEVWH